MKKYKFTNIVISLIISVVILAFLISLYANAVNNTLAKTGKSTSSNDIYNALLLGKDNAAGLCDVIVLVSIDLIKNSINIMQIPRDTYFDYDNGDHNKINGAPHVLGVSTFVDKLEASLGTNIDFYLSLDTQTLKDMVDMISGVEVDIPKDMDYDDLDQNLHIQAFQYAQ